MSMLNRLSPHVKAVESRRKGKLMEVPRKNLDLGRDSFYLGVLLSGTAWIKHPENVTTLINLKGFSKQ